MMELVKPVQVLKKSVQLDVYLLDSTPYPPPLTKSQLIPVLLVELVHPTAHLQLSHLNATQVFI